MLFDSMTTRPTPEAVAQLLENGLHEGILADLWEADGATVPCMLDTSRELDTLLPHIQRVNDILAHDAADLVLYAGRDAEVAFDDARTRYPDIDARLLPASTDLWSYREKAPSLPRRLLGARPDPLWKDFLGEFGITEDFAHSEATVDVIDSGFMGSIAAKLQGRVWSTYGVWLTLDSINADEGRLRAQLVHADSGSYGSTITEADPNIDVLRDLPKTSRSGGVDIDDPTHALATAMQIMPRYHGAYDRLERRGDRVVAVPSFEFTTPDVDLIGYDGFRVNESVVNPYAAAIAQVRTVRAALELE